MNRQPFLNLLNQYTAHAHQNERSTLANLKQRVEQNAFCFTREHIEGAVHLASSILLVTPDFSRALFMWHSKIQRWTQPGALESALTELHEEVGISNALPISTIPLDIECYNYASDVFGYSKTIYNLCFIAVISNDEEPRILEPDKCTSLQWFTPSEALRATQVPHHQGTSKLIKKWIAFKKITESLDVASLP